MNEMNQRSGYSKPRTPRSSDLLDLDPALRDRLIKARDHCSPRPSLTHLAEACGHSQSWATHIFSKTAQGQQQTITRDELTRLCRVLGADPAKVEHDLAKADTSTQVNLSKSESDPTWLNNSPLLENLLGAAFYVPRGNFNPEEGRNLILSASFGDYSDPDVEPWTCKFHLERCSVYVNTSAPCIAGDRDEREVASSSDTGHRLLIKRDRNQPQFRRYAVESTISKDHLRGDFQIDICLLKDSSASCHARIRAAYCEMGVTKNTEGKTLKGVERNRILDQWVKVMKSRDAMDPDGCLTLCEEIIELV